MGMGFSLAVNCAQISSQVSRCPAVIKNKYIETIHSRSGTHYHYHLGLMPWQFSNLTNDVVTSKLWFDNLYPHDTIYININYGLLKTPWYQLQGYKKASGY